MFKPLPRVFTPGQPGVVSVPAPESVVQSRQQGHEVSDVSPGTMLWFVAGFFGVIFSVMGALAWMYSHLYTAARARPVPPAQGTFQHAPRAKTSIAKDWESIDAQTRQRLKGYHWVEPDEGVVSIPVDRAMELIGREGLPARAGETPYFPPPDQVKRPLMELETNPNALSFDPH